MTLADIRDVLVRELAARALGGGDVSSEFARGNLLKRVGTPLVLRYVRREDRVLWQDNLYGEAALVVERVERDQVMFESPRLVVAMTDFCKAVANGKALDP